MSGTAGDAAAAAMIAREPERFAARFPARFLRRVRKPAVPQLPACAECPVPIGEGGLWAALWRLGEQAKTGLAVDAVAVPILQETVELCEAAGEDPYRLPSAGAVFLMEPSDAASMEDAGLRRLIERRERMDAGSTGEPAAGAAEPAFAVIGHTTEHAARTVRIGERIRYLDRG